MPSSTVISKSDSVLIVGAGVFGLSTALELTKRGYSSVTVVDRYLPPVADGSSVDISRVIRTDYADPLYARMGREALRGWKTEYSAHYHESGFVMLASRKDGHPYLDKIREVSKSVAVPLDEFEDAADVSRLFPAFQSRTDDLRASVNSAGGWADAEAAVRQLAMSCSAAGVSFVTGRAGTVTSLRYGADGAVIGVNVLSGGFVNADQVVLSTGAWTNRLIGIEHTASASGQPVGFIQLTPEEADRLRGLPVIINFNSGVFVFPVTPGSNILKVARHSYGFGTKVEVKEGERAGAIVSSPKRDSNGAASSFLPEEAEQALRDGLSQLVPEFASHPWSRKRLCWYTDTPEGDFIIDAHPTVKGLFLATGGAGHAFKFLPVLGKYVADCFENKAPKEVRHQWRLRRPEGNGSKDMKPGDGSRGGPPLRVLSRLEQAKL
ncbi:FAD dependent oxidoreductase [Plectosphaerella plurivora]|uniref:FAD dependent oxidoreductase n=1 Tax=Plectosphaerella plurivora TaxID=936078 RepID=A0A9P8VHE3_9PEZI|nr:FAD dependent oxidoreductase [Plectosphaerella plurivora]